MNDDLLAQALLGRLAHLLEAELGLAYPPEKRRELAGAVRQMATATGAASPADCMAWLLGGGWTAEKADLCAVHLTVGETYFFREPRAFDLLIRDVAAKQAGAAPLRYRIWSAGCCTGEEPYSIAMTLARAFPTLAPGAVSILATDLSPRNLALAREGVYRPWSFRNTGEDMRQRYFTPQSGGGLRIADPIRRLVRFEQLNLAAPDYAPLAGEGKFDIIFCRNVLMYFSRDLARQVIARLRACLADGGWLVVSPSEADSALFAGFKAHYHPDAVHFRKTAQHAAAGPQTALTSRAAPARRPAAVRSPRAAQARAAAPAGRVPAAEAPAAADPAALHARALAQMEGGELRAGVASLRQAIYLQPDFILAHFLMAELQGALGRQADARRSYQAAMRLLDALDDGAIVPAADGMAAGYLRECVRYRLQGGH